MHTKTTPMSFI